METDNDPKKYDPYGRAVRMLQAAMLVVLVSYGTYGIGYKHGQIDQRLESLEAAARTSHIIQKERESGSVDTGKSQSVQSAENKNPQEEREPADLCMCFKSEEGDSKAWASCPFSCTSKDEIELCEETHPDYVCG